MAENDTAKPKVIEFRSEHSPTVLYACGDCGFTNLNRELAEQCCRCTQCGMKVDRRGGTAQCQDCSAASYREQAARRRAAAMQLPVVEGHDGPVFVADNEKWYSDVDAAAEAIYDDAGDPTQALVHPCSVGNVAVPDVHSYVDEAWGDNFEDGIYDGLPKDAVEAIDVLLKVLAGCAPVVWTADFKKRVVLPVVTVSPAAKAPGG